MRSKRRYFATVLVQVFESVYMNRNKMVEPPRVVCYSVHVQEKPRNGEKNLLSEGLYKNIGFNMKYARKLRNRVSSDV